MPPSHTWGLVATILAPADDILRFVAFHLEAGAHRLYIYLDAENPIAFDALKAHPKVRVTQCNADWWAKKANRRPHKHQARQVINATHAYHRKAEVDWLIHIDVDEFLVSDQPVAVTLSSLPTDVLCARVRPMEALAGDITAFKGFIPGGPARDKIVKDIYPTFGPSLKGGFLSHLAGKVFVRSQLIDVRINIHNAFQNNVEIKSTNLDQDTLALAHCHATTWETWLTAYRYRLAKGSYRSELAPNKSRDTGGVTIHELFNMIERREGEVGLRAFFDEVCADTPQLRARLDHHGLLRKVNLQLSSTLSTHFPHLKR